MRLVEHVTAFAECVADAGPPHEVRERRDDVILALWLLAGAPPSSPAVERAALRASRRIELDHDALHAWLTQHPACTDLVAALWRIAADAQSARARAAADRLAGGTR